MLLCLVLVSASVAEILTTATPMGQGKWGVEGVYMLDSNFANVSNYSLASIGGYVAYGITSMLDIYLNLGSSTANGLPSGVESSVLGYGPTLKYCILQEGKTLPVSVAVAAGYKVLSSKMKSPLGDTTASGSQIAAGFGVSKMIIPFIPYAGVIYRSTTISGGDGTQIDATVGTAVAWSEQGAVLIEYTLQSITPKGGANYSSGQISAGVGYTL